MSNLFSESVSVARDNNFREMCADTSTDGVAKLANNLGFDSTATLSYSEFKYQGVTVFDELPQRNQEWRELATHKRKVPSDMY